MTLLSVVTSGVKGSMSLNTTHQVEWDKKAMHSELATLKLKELLASTNAELKTITHLAVSIGPGSFTGIRVGLNLARTLSYALNLPIAGINTLETLAFLNLAEGESGLIAIKAVQHYYYAAVYKKLAGNVVQDVAPCSLPVSDLPRGMYSKTLIEDETPGFSIQIQALDLGRWCLTHPKSRMFSSWKSVEPLYIRGSEAEEKLRQGLLKPL